MFYQHIFGVKVFGESVQRFQRFSGSLRVLYTLADGCRDAILGFIYRLVVLRDAILGFIYRRVARRS
jgi:hypothetical protein